MCFFSAKYGCFQNHFSPLKASSFLVNSGLSLINNAAPSLISVTNVDVSLFGRTTLASLGCFLVSQAQPAATLPRPQVHGATLPLCPGSLVLDLSHFVKSALIPMGLPSAKSMTWQPRPLPAACGSAWEVPLCTWFPGEGPFPQDGCAPRHHSRGLRYLILVSKSQWF